MENIYDIQVNMPLGVRHGKMWFLINHGTLSGKIQLLGSTEVFDGTLSDDGTLKIKGYLSSPVRRMPYTAVGKIQNQRLDLSLHYGSEIFLLTGQRSKPDDTERKLL